MKIPQCFSAFWVLGISLFFASYIQANECKPILSPLRFQKLADTLENCNVERIENLLPLLPEDFRSRYVLVYNSRSLQDATPRFPRVIMFGLDAKFILAFAGHSNLKGYDSLETIEFNDQTKKFQFRSISFPAEKIKSAKTQNLKPLISEENPKRCMVCHREELRPNWDTYSAWPGVYGSVDDQMPAREEEKYQEFKNEIYRKLGRYRYLEQAADYPDKAWYIDYYRWGRPNLQFSMLLSLLNSQAIARELKENKKLYPFRYALLASLTCRENFYDADVMAQVIPAALTSKFPRSFQSVADEVNRNVEKSHEFRDKRQCSLLQSLGGQLPIADWNCEFARKELGYTYSTNRVKFIMEGAGVNFPEWSMEFGSAHDVFFAGTLGQVGELGLFLWHELLDPEEDKDIYAMYEQAWKDRSEWGALIWSSGTENLCSQLRKKSLAALSATSQ